jgi:hypothetical protein
VTLTNATVGRGTSYDLTTGVIIDMSESIYMLSPDDTPLLNGVGGDGRLLLPSAPATQVKFEWQDEEILLPRSTAQVTFVTAATTLQVAAGHRAKFSTGDVLRLQKVAIAAPEVVRVTAYSTEVTDGLVVEREYDGTTAQQAAQGAIVLGVGTALPEGSDPEEARAADRTARYNYTQIFGPTLVHMSRTEQQVRRYGVPSEWAKQLYNRSLENAIAREQAFLYGRRTNSATTKIRTTGGFEYFITSNVNSTATQITLAGIQTAQQTAYNNGGAWDLLVGTPQIFADMNDLSNTSIVRTTNVDSVRGRRPVLEIWTEFGVVTAVRNRWVMPSEAFGLRKEGIRRRVLQPFMGEPLAKTGDSDKWQVLAEEGLEVVGETQMAKWTNLSYTL